MDLVVETLNTSVHARELFSNFDPDIETFLKRHANKENKLHVSDTYVVVNQANRFKILGYFTLSNHSVTLCDIPDGLKKRLPQYPSVGTVLLGRMGRDQNLTPSGFGTILLKEALRHSLLRGSFYALELHAKNEKLIKYYQQFGFIQLKDSKLHMLLPYRTISEVLT